MSLFNLSFLKRKQRVTLRFVDNKGRAETVRLRSGDSMIISHTVDDAGANPNVQFTLTAVAGRIEIL